MAIQNYTGNTMYGQPVQATGLQGVAPAAPAPQVAPTTGPAAVPSALPTYTPTGYAQTPTEVVGSSLEAFLNPNSAYITQARQAGANYANSRGGINSSIAAGAAEREAINAASGLATQALGIQQQRENVANQFQMNEQTARIDDWMSSNNINRQFQYQLALMPIQNSYQMLNMLQQFALSDPELYTPEVVSGYSNFFTKNMQDITANYFKDLFPT